MPRKREGSLAYKNSTGWNARVWVTLKSEDGTVRTERRWVKLGTYDRDVAQRKLERLVAGLASGEIVADGVKREATRSESVEEAARSWCKQRKAEGVSMDELQLFEDYVFEAIGAMPVISVKKGNIKSLLRAVNAMGRSKQTVVHVRLLLLRFFKGLEKDEVIPNNPVRLVELGDVGRLKVDTRPFTIPTDEEIAMVFGSPEVDVEAKLIILVARTLGGARAKEVNRWSWEMVDTEAFATCKLARAKGEDQEHGHVQDFVIPEVLRPFLRAWWEGHGQPVSGPVFPVARGKRKGEARSRTNYAVRVRRAFWKAGCRRKELHKDTDHSRKLNFHSTGRRAFVSALAASGTNEQTAMALAHHADSRVHKRYQLAQIREVPIAALPVVDTAAASDWAPAVAKRSKRSPVGAHGTPIFSERDTGFEPATSSLGSTPTTAQRRELSEEVESCGLEEEIADPACSGVLPHEKARAGSFSREPEKHEADAKGLGGGQPGEVVWH